MLNGTDPIILIQFYEAPPEVKSALSKIPILSAYQDRIGLPPIPIYLSENLTGLYIVSEDKNVDIQTKTETLSDGKTPFVSQQRGWLNGSYQPAGFSRLHWCHSTQRVS
jgi:hypothetical protein